MKRTIRYLVPGLMALVTGLACRQASAPAQPADPLEEAVMATSSALATTPVPSAIPMALCPVPAGEYVTPDMNDPTNAAAGVQDYLNNGGSTAALREVIEAQPFAAPPGGLYSVADFNGDGFQDIAATVLEFSEEDPQVKGTLYIFVCEDESFRLVYTTPTFEGLGAPVVFASEDLNVDQKSDLLIGRGICGAAVCSEQLQVLIWQDGTVTNRLEGTSDDLPTPLIEIDRANPLDKKIIATGVGSGSSGAGPLRPRQRIWAWSQDSESFVQQEDRMLASNYRIHALHDADTFASEGQFEAALSKYNQVVFDDALLDWVDPPVERTNLSAYAQFRTMLAQLQMGDTQSAAATYNTLQIQYPGEFLGNAYATMAEAFWTDFTSEEGTLASACAEARAVAILQSEEILEPLYFGFANPSYGAAEVCPIQEE